MNRAIPELLAPAGGTEALKAAVRFGADAVYGGMRQFGLRAFAHSFSESELTEAVKICHEHGRKFYVTLNAFLYDDILDPFLKAAMFAYNAGADAAIVSDPGAVNILRTHIPGLNLHISTQANTLNSAAAAVYHQLGVKRVIAGRELSLARLRFMRENTPQGLELETFCHGAMCMAYSGRCHLSASMAGRSANEGACAQPCRWKYSVAEEKRPGESFPVYEDASGTYLYSARDLNLMPLLPELIRCKLTSVKIEGRMKSEYYVATVTAAYRRGLDAYQRGEAHFFKLLPELMNELSKASHREWDTGFAKAPPANGCAVGGYTQSAEYTARVLRDAEANEPALAMLKNRFYAGDTLEVLTPEGIYPYTPSELILAETGQPVTTHGTAGTLILLRFPFKVGAGDFIRGPVRNHRTDASPVCRP